MKRKILLVVFGVFFAFLITESVLRIAGFMFLRGINPANSGTKNKNTYRIMCLGESTTVWGGQESWPSQMEEILNQSNTGVDFEVINKGRHAIESSVIISGLKKNLNKYRPDMVVAMMGVNDGDYTLAFEDSFSSRIKLFFRGLRSAKLARILFKAVANRINGIKRHFAGKKQKPPQKNSFISGRKDNRPDNTRSEDEPKRELLSARHYEEEGRYDLAEECLKKILERRKDDPQMYFRLGSYYWRRQRYQEAENILKKGLVVQPDDMSIYYKLVCCYQNMGENAKAIELLREMLKIDKNDEWAYTYLGWCYMDMHNYSQAEKMFKKAIMLNPSNAIPSIELCDLYRKQNKGDKIEKIIKQVMGLYSKDKQPYSYHLDRFYGFVAMHYFEQKKYRIAEKYFRKLREIRLKYYNPATFKNYQTLKNILRKRKIPLVCAQYAVRDIDPLKKIVGASDNVIFVDNEKVFKDALKKGNYYDYFVDKFGGDFGHGTPEGNRLLAENIAAAILKEYFPFADESQ